MRVQLRIQLEASADAVWDAIHNPVVFRTVSSPLLAIYSTEPTGAPRRWQGDGPHRIEIRAFNVIRMGTQTIDISSSTRPDGTRIMTDRGKPQSGALLSIRSWRHRMAVTPLPGGTTLYRDRLDFSAGALTPLLWLSLWSFWQWRGFRLKQLARRQFENLPAQG